MKYLLLLLLMITTLRDNRISQSFGFFIGIRFYNNSNKFFIINYNFHLLLLLFYNYNTIFKIIIVCKIDKISTGILLLLILNFLVYY